MLTTYRAKLRDSKLEWTDEAPPIAKSVETQVLVTVLPETKSQANDRAERRRQAVGALEKLAAMGGIKAISDPIAWQREMSEDRPLPGHDGKN